MERELVPFQMDDSLELPSNRLDSSAQVSFIHVHVRVDVCVCVCFGFIYSNLYDHAYIHESVCAHMAWSVYTRIGTHTYWYTTVILGLIVCACVCAGLGSIQSQQREVRCRVWVRSLRVCVCVCVSVCVSVRVCDCDCVSVSVFNTYFSASVERFQHVDPCP